MEENNFKWTKEWLRSHNDRVNSLFLSQFHLHQENNLLEVGIGSDPRVYMYTTIWNKLWTAKLIGSNITWTLAWGGCPWALALAFLNSIKIVPTKIA